MNFSAYINLLKTMVGTGLIAYPGLVQSNGVLGVLFLSIIGLLFSMLGLYLFAECNSLINKKSTMISITQYIWSPLSSVASAVLILKCFLVSAAYMSAIYDLLKTLFISYDLSDYLIRMLTILIISCCIPLILMNKIDKLKFSSFFGITAAFIMILSSLFWVVSGKFNRTLKIYGNPTFSSFGKIVFGFTCHQNIFTIQNELNLSIKSTIATILFSGISAWALYLGFGIINAHGPLIEDKNTYIDMIPNTVLGRIIRINYILIIILSIPLQISPCHNSILELMKIDPSQKKNYFLKILSLLIIIGSAFSVSVFSDNLNSLFKGIGSTVSSVLCFILPGSYYLIYKDERKSTLTTFLSIICILFGLFVIFSYLMETFQ
ncbi:Vacuolar amino acid transporter 5 [Dictyocoela muelleri]|nr:Vacuolar amino acid transporter 5 [Dictyocoela muelleri]